MENLIKELERIANDNEQKAKKLDEKKSFLAAENAKGIAYGINFAINIFKSQIALNGDKK